jgi:multicomponent Na+:H+ antiporter subunit F
MSPLPLVLSLSGLVLAFSVFLCLIRLSRGPSVMDRILAFDTICCLIVGLMVLVSVRWRSSLYIDLILVFTLLGFFSTVAFSLYLHRTYDAAQDHPQLRRRRRKP